MTSVFLTLAKSFNSFERESSVSGSELWEAKFSSLLQNSSGELEVLLGAVYM